MSFLNPRPPPPPATTIIVTQPQYSSISTPTDVLNDNSTSGESSPSPSTSIIIVIIVIASAIIVSATIYLLLRLLSRRCRRTFRTYSSADDVVVPDIRAPAAATTRSVLDTLPLFTFGSLNKSFTGGDCAVCLSKFEPPDQLRLLPLCCHAFHSDCIGTWLASNLSCPLCRSTVNPTDRDVLNKILASSQNPRDRSGETGINGGGDGNNSNVSRSGSFRVEIGSVSRRRDSVDDRRSYSVGDFDYIVDDACEVPADSVGIPDCTSAHKSTGNITVTGPPGENLAADVAGNRSSWLRDYVDRLSSYSFSSRTMSFRSSGRFFAGSSRRSEVVVPIDDLEANRQGEEISEFFRWLSPV